MKILVFGHRGSGKSLAASRMVEYFKLPLIDLDKEVSDDIPAFFERYGESAFRKKEIEHFERIYRKKDSFILSLGAGFKGELPSDAICYWIMRPSDSDGRIFLNRPRLNKDILPLEEFFIRKRERDLRFQKNYIEKILIPEGFTKANPIEEQYFLNQVDLKQYSITISKDIFIKKERLDHYFSSRLNWNICFFEIRDDLLSDSQIRFCLDKIAKDKILLSFRKKPANKIFLDFLNKNPNCRWDWALELGEANFSQKYDILSMHEYSLNQALEEVEKRQGQANEFKLALEIESTKDLIKGHQWLKGQKTASFLPRSNNGKWKWYRMHFNHLQSLNFLADDNANIADQPWPLETLYNKDLSRDKFTAVLGKPVSHSLSPSEHYDFFKNYNLPFYAIEANDQHEISDFISLGLKYAAVTSPLKKEVLKQTYENNYSDTVKKFVMANTLALSDNNIMLDNTDHFGLEKLLDKVDEPCVLWGGGALINNIKAINSKISAYSFRQGRPRENEEEILNPKTIIWAVSRKHYLKKEALWPPDHWQPEKIIDLHYTLDSPALEYAQDKKCQYISGLTLFKIQAKKQQDFWSKYVGK